MAITRRKQIEDRIVNLNVDIEAVKKAGANSQDKKYRSLQSMRSVARRQLRDMSAAKLDEEIPEEGKEQPAEEEKPKDKPKAKRTKKVAGKKAKDHVEITDKEGQSTVETDTPEHFEPESEYADGNYEAFSLTDKGIQMRVQNLTELDNHLLASFRNGTPADHVTVRGRMAERENLLNELRSVGYIE